MEEGKFPRRMCRVRQDGGLNTNAGELPLLTAWTWRWCSQRRMRRGSERYEEVQRIG